MGQKLIHGLIVAIFLVFLNVGAVSGGQDGKQPAVNPAAGETLTFSRAQVVLITASGRHRFDVELALTDAQLRLGLMNRRQLPAQAGMLFDFGRARPVAMWMKNTLIPLDMIFVAAGGRIIRIAENTEPQSLQVIASGGDARMVLEVNAGTAARLGLKAGDRMELKVSD